MELRGFALNPAGINRNGRPKMANTISSKLRLLLRTPIEEGSDRTKGDLIAELILEKAMGGDQKALEMLADRTEGKAPQSFGSFTEDGDLLEQSPIVVQFTSDSDTENKSEEVAKTEQGAL